MQLRCAHSINRWAAQTSVRCVGIARSVQNTAPGDQPGMQFTITPDTIPPGNKARLDAFLAQQLDGSISRGRVQSAIKAGHVLVNGQPCTKASMEVKLGDVVQAVVPAPPALQALPEEIPLDVVYEDAHVLVVNKAPGMVVHPAPGHYTGTLVNAVLAHCQLPLELLQLGIQEQQASSSSSDTEDDEEEDVDWSTGPAVGSLTTNGLTTNGLTTNGLTDDGGREDSIRPGIVHRLDIGTSGLLVVAKDVTSLWKLSQQFKDRTVQRTYHAIALGTPSPPVGTVKSNITRDLRDRKRMAAAPYEGARGKPAVSGYQVIRPVAGGAASYMMWKLQTGRTHQIRVHAKQIGHPLVGDATYGGVSGAHGAWQRAHGGNRAARAFETVVSSFGRPALHAKTLGFAHPVTGEWMQFDSNLPADMQALVQELGI